jgi:predicted ATPase with chaperone activity
MTSTPETQKVFIPPSINKVEDTGLSPLWLQDLILKVLYYQGDLIGIRISEVIKLPFAGVVANLLDALKREKLVEVRSSQGGFGEGGYLYVITNAGIERAREALGRSQYAGPAPVPLEVYNEASLQQKFGQLTVTQDKMRQALSHLVFNEHVFHRLGPAFNSGASIFLYGPPGNGKTSVARSMGQLVFTESIFIPFAISIDGQVIKLYDSLNHELDPMDEHVKTNSGILSTSARRDPRWVRIRRPFIVVGGELTLAGLDLVYNDTVNYYEAPFQVKANGGILLIDDFGRQQVHPRDLLNRWIVPLENRIDYLTLHTGRKVETVFDVLVIFSTNLPPTDLVDEAFLRRIRHKIEIEDPTYEEYREIFRQVAKNKNVTYDDQGLAYLLQEFYIKPERNLRASHPRDICDQILDISRYTSSEPIMTRELIDRAAQSYFVEL